MNSSELLVKRYLVGQGHKVEKIYGREHNMGLPDFLVDDEFYVEVKRIGAAFNFYITANQIIKLKQVEKPVYFFIVWKDQIYEVFEYGRRSIYPVGS